MRLHGLTLLAGAFLLAACGGGDRENAGGTATDEPGATANTGGTATGTATAMPITGTTHEVRMIGDAQGYRFEPANITIRQGDGIKWVMVSGGPHNVAFDPSDIPDQVEPQLSANMPSQVGPLSSPMMMTPDQSYTISFAGVQAGSYDYHCTPHLALGMVGNITVE
ncbi:MAG: plastocyanin/azurin family copper-binding protein [Gemmatimonadaceae bacterium]